METELNRWRGGEDSAVQKHVKWLHTVFNISVKMKQDKECQKLLYLYYQIMTIMTYKLKLERVRSILSGKIERSIIIITPGHIMVFGD